MQKRLSLIINRYDKSTSIFTQLHSSIPASKISTLTEGMFIGADLDNFEERIEKKIFHVEIVADNEKLAIETKAYQKVPQFLSFVDDEGEDRKTLEIETNYKQIKIDIVEIMENELDRNKNDPDLQHLVN